MTLFSLQLHINSTYSTKHSITKWPRRHKLNAHQLVCDAVNFNITFGLTPIGFMTKQSLYLHNNMYISIFIHHLFLINHMSYHKALIEHILAITEQQQKKTLTGVS